MTTAALAESHVLYTKPVAEDQAGLTIDLRRGLAATGIDGELVRASQARNVTCRILAFYLDELQESGKFRDLGYSCLAQYADLRLGIERRRARELCQAGRALTVLTQIDQAFLAGSLSWTKAELLTHGVRVHEQEEWIGRAQDLSCAVLRQMLARHRKGLSTERGADGGLPRSEYGMGGLFSQARFNKIEAVREDLMRRRGVLVDDSEVLNFIVDEHKLCERDGEREAELAAECEQKETPEWLRRKVLARDRHQCKACGGSERLHVHHIVFRSQGGLTREENLTSACVSCHGLIHEGRLFARVGSAGRVEFHNRFGDAVMASGNADACLPRPVLRILRGENCGVGGGQPPAALPALPALPMDTDHSMIPDEEMGEWFKARMHLYEPDRNGVWRVKKGVR